jgi:hypothetical protein
MRNEDDGNDINNTTIDTSHNKDHPQQELLHTLDPSFLMTTKILFESLLHKWCSDPDESV